MAAPAHWGLRRRLLDQLARLRLARPAVRLYEIALAARSAILGERVHATNGLPVPPARMRVRIGPLHSDASHFLRSSQIHGELIRSVVEESGSPIEDLGAILDFGCGYGRVLREWWRLPRTRVFGCDIDPKAVEWCNSRLPFAEVTANDLAPPLPYEGSSFDLVYALSVFTHLSESLQRPWIEECMRVLRPGGLLLFSTLGEHYVSLGRLTDSERLSFRDGNIVVLFDTSAGTSLCSAYHPYEYVRRELASGFELVLVRPAAADGQDVYLLRKPPAAGPARDAAD